MFEILWQYTLVFVLAATPWMEILVVIPIGIGIGLDPFLVAIISFAGNFLPIVLIIWLLNWFKTTNMYAWWQKRKHGKKEKNTHRHGDSACFRNMDCLVLLFSDRS